MNIDKVIHHYFGQCKNLPTIEVFDADSIYSVYKSLFASLVRHADFELTVLQALSYCLYEVLDNVIIHSQKQSGAVLLHYDAEQAVIKILIADEGIGIHKSLTENPQYASLTEAEALEHSVRDSVSDGKGMGFGLFTTSRLMETAGIRLDIHSGTHALCYDSGGYRIEDRQMWQGTLVFMEIHTDIEISPNEIVDNRTDAESEFNDTFINNENEQLW